MGLRTLDNHGKILNLDTPEKGTGAPERLRAKCLGKRAGKKGRKIVEIEVEAELAEKIEAEGEYYVDFIKAAQ